MPEFKKNLKNYACNDISKELKLGEYDLQNETKTLIGQFQRWIEKEIKKRFESLISENQ